jgi:hypothetical protein
MPTTFLDLPRELRDEIYAFLLISPSGVVSPHWVPRPLKPSSPKPAPFTAQTSTARFTLCINPPKPRIVAAYNLKDFDRPRNERQYISLSLPRTCRQIYDETQGLFWERNTFYFSSHNAGVIRTLKIMGQVSSRLITSVTIRMDDREIIAQLSKTLNVLASRARFGHFRRLELIWDSEEFEVLKRMSLQIPMARARQYDELLEGLRTGERGGRFERVIRLPHLLGDGLNGKDAEACARDLHFAFGGRLFWGDVLGWESWKPIVPT